MKNRPRLSGHRAQNELRKGLDSVIGQSIEAARAILHVARLFACSKETTMRRISLHIVKAPHGNIAVPIVQPKGK